MGIQPRGSYCHAQLEAALIQCFLHVIHDRDPNSCRVASAVDPVNLVINSAVGYSSCGEIPLPWGYLDARCCGLGLTLSHKVHHIQCPSVQHCRSVRVTRSSQRALCITIRVVWPILRASCCARQLETVSRTSKTFKPTVAVVLTSTKMVSEEGFRNSTCEESA